VPRRGDRERVQCQYVNNIWPKILDSLSRLFNIFDLVTFPVRAPVSEHDLDVIRAVLANVNSRSRSLYAVARPYVCLSVVRRLSVCNSRAPYSYQTFEIFGNISTTFNWYLGHPLTSGENSTEIVPGEPLRRGS